LFIIVPAALWPQPAKPTAVITQADQIRHLTPEEAAEGRPVRIRGVVTMDAPASCCVQFRAPAGRTGYLGGTPWHQANTTINVNDNVTWVRSNHTLKAGIFYQRSRKDQVAWNNINGGFNFNLAATGGGTCPGPDSCTLGDPIASALIGEFQSFSQSTARPLGKFRYNQFEFYLQDTWKVTSRLTLDYGMRFSWIPLQYDANNPVALFDPVAYDPATAVTIDSNGNVVPGSGNPLDGMTYTKNHEIPTGGWNSRGVMPEPRLGFAYDLFGTHKTILRGGGAMMHDRTQGNLIFNTVFNNPALVQTAQLSAGNIADLPGAVGSFGNGVQGDKNIIGASRDGKVPTVYSFSLGIQHEIAHGTTLDLAYVGTLSRHLITARDGNTIPYGTAFTREAQDPNNYAGGVVPAVEPNLNPVYAAAGLSFSGIYAYGHPAYTNAALVPYKGYGQITYLEFDGTSNSNSLQASLQRRLQKFDLRGGLHLVKVIGYRQYRSGLAKRLQCTAPLPQPNGTVRMCLPPTTFTTCLVSPSISVGRSGFPTSPTTTNSAASLSS